MKIEEQNLSKGRSKEEVSLLGPIAFSVFGARIPDT